MRDFRECSHFFRKRILPCEELQTTRSCQDTGALEGCKEAATGGSKQNIERQVSAAFVLVLIPLLKSPLHIVNGICSN